jgi:hypothetical protein
LEQQQALKYKSNGPKLLNIDNSTTVNEILENTKKLNIYLPFFDDMEGKGMLLEEGMEELLSVFCHAQVETQVEEKKKDLQKM